MICMIPKVASTSLGNFIIGVHQIAKGGGTRKNIALRILLHILITILSTTFVTLLAIHNLGFSGNYTNNVNKATYRTMVVRHPLDRIVSAYKFIFHDEVKSKCKN